MIQSPLVMNRTLSKNRNRQWPFECLLEEQFDRSGLRKYPVPEAIIANERSRFNQYAFANRAELCDLLFAFNLDDCLGNLSIGSSNLLLHSADLQVCISRGAFTLLEIMLGDKPFCQQLL